MKKFLSFLMASVLCFQTTTLLADELGQWLQEQKTLAFNRLLRNISPAGTAKGVVIASPSQKEPDYYFHWVRDAALVMDVVFNRYLQTETENDKKFLEEIFIDFVEFSAKNQATPNPSGGPGEPKFNVDGSAFLGDWGRPQDDGPALRALIFTRFAKLLLNQGKEELVRTRLYNSSKKSLIKLDLEYVSHSWKNTSFDPWEEVKGHHFFIEMVQRKAMLEGAWLAERLGDGGAAAWYRTQAKEMESLILRHWDSVKGIIVATIDRDGGVDYKHSGIDTSVVLGLLHGDAGDGFYKLSDDRVLSTVNKMEKVFYDLYPINQTGQRGIAIGRYPEDRYDGYSTSGVGNPWIINTATFGEFYHRLALLLKNAGRIEITETNAPFFHALGMRSLKAGQVVQERNEVFREAIQKLIRKGDDFLYRVKFHSDSGGSLSEQINLHSGYMQGARDLTWSYASLLSAIDHRSKSLKAGN